MCTPTEEGSMKVKVSQKVYDGIEAVRMSGLTNMLDRGMVQVLCNRMGYHEAVVWIEENKDKYGQLIILGLEVE